MNPIVFEHYPVTYYGDPECITIRWDQDNKRFMVDQTKTSRQGSDMFRIATNMAQKGNNFLKVGADWNKIVFYTKRSPDDETSTLFM